MPEAKNVPEIPSVVLANEPLPSPEEILGRDYALQLVTDTFYHYERERQTHDRRWTLNDMLYAKWVPERFWPGTKVPRSSLGAGIVFEQVEGAIPMISQALFSQPEFFSLEADYGSDGAAARAQQAHLEYAFDATSGRRGMVQEMEYKSAFKDMLIYGNGVVKNTYDAELRLPSIEHLDIRDLYFDPYCPGPAIDRSRSIIERRLMTIDEIKAYRSDKRMNIPSDDELWGLAVNFDFAYADNGRRIQEGFRSNSYNPGQSNILPLPSDRQIEVLMYWDHYRVVWVLGRKFVMYNDKNVYGFLPYSVAPCYTYPGRTYGMSIADVQEGYQRYMEGLMNGRLDYVNLSLFPPRFMQRGSIMNPNQQMWGPNQVFQADDPTKTFIHTTSDATSSIFQEIGFLQQAADRVTGINQMSLGITSPSNSNRTAAGINSQLQGAALRLHSIVENIENFLLIPSIQKAIRMVRIHSVANEQLPGRVSDENGQNQQFVQVSSQAFAQNSRVKVRAASKMLSRDRLTQLYQFIAQNVLSGQVLQALSQKGETIDIDEMMTMLMDATGIAKRYKIIRPMNDQEKQAMQQQQEQAQKQQTNADLQKAQLDAQTRLQMGQMKAQSDQAKNQTDLQIAQMKSGGPTPMELQQQAQESQQKMAIEAQKAENDRQKAQMDMVMKQKELEFQQAKTQLELAASHAQNQQKMNQMAAESQARQVEAMMNAQHTSQMQSMEREHLANSNAQELQFGREKSAMAQQAMKQKMKDQKAAAGKSKV